MSDCEKIRKRFRITDVCCDKGCHGDDDTFLEGLLQGGVEAAVCCNVVAGVEMEGAFCDIHGEWYPPGLQCLACKNER